MAEEAEEVAGIRHSGADPPHRVPREARLLSTAFPLTEEVAAVVPGAVAVRRAPLAAAPEARLRLVVVRRVERAGRDT